MLLRESVSGSKHWLRKLSTTGLYLCSMMSLGCHNLFSSYFALLLYAAKQQIKDSKCSW